MSDLNYLDTAAKVQRDTVTEKRVRAMDTHDVVQEIHDLEDRIEALENPD